MANSIMALWRKYFSFAVCYEQMLDPHQHYLFADYPHGAFPLSQLLALTVRHLACWQGENSTAAGATASAGTRRCLSLAVGRGLHQQTLILCIMRSPKLLCLLICRVCTAASCVLQQQMESHLL